MSVSDTLADRGARYGDFAKHAVIAQSLQTVMRGIASERLASNIRLQSQLDAKTQRLERIAALETPNCASIGKRMAKIARGEG